MVSSTPAKEEGPLPPPPITKGGAYSVNDIRVGNKVFITRPLNATGSATEERLAEVLSIRHKPASNAPTPGSTRMEEDESTIPADRIDFFVHWHLFNKRLDEWVSATRVKTNKDMEWPRPKVQAPPPGADGIATPTGKPAAGVALKKNTAPSTPKASGVQRQMSLLKKATLNAASFQGSPSGIGQKRKQPPGDDDDEDAEGDPGSPTGSGIMDLDDEDVSTPFDPSAALQTFASKGDELEKLRHSGSMTQQVGEIARVKNLNRIQMGRAEVEAWYFSPYPVEYAHLPVLYLCEFCLAYYPSQFMLGRHRKNCLLTHPPGNEIYRHKESGPHGEEISFFEVDGKKQVTWCRNLSLLSKCFLDHKTLYFDVQPFLYYVMTTNDERGNHTIGYFSKEKESAEGYNVACILTLPQYQRKGYGKLLIEFSYELSKRENKLGSPEKPLSDLGLLGYKAYWMETILEALLPLPDQDISIEEIANRSSITQNDIMWTCTQMGLFKHYKNQHVICLTDQVKAQYEKAKSKQRRRIDPGCIFWKPPIFTREQLRFGY